MRLKKILAVKSKITRALPHGAQIDVCDNSGAKILRLISVKKIKTTKGRIPAGGIGDLILASVIKGKPEMRKKVVFAVIVRQKKEYRRPDGTRVKFESNAAVVLKDDKGNPQGTIFKGPIAKESCERWPGIAKIASIIV
jgi:large subunit ribosomal protein L14